MIIRNFWITKINAAWKLRPIVWLSGVRRVSKTILSKMFSQTKYLNCDLPSTWRILQDPESFYKSIESNTNIVFDEIHRLEDPRSLLKIAADEFLEWEEVYPDHFYGTLKKEVSRITQSGYNVLFDVDVVGGLNIKKQYEGEALAVFVQPPDIQELERRLHFRSTDSKDKIQMRVKKAKYEMSFAEKFDIVIVNDDLEKALKDAENAVSSFLLKSE